MKKLFSIVAGASLLASTAALADGHASGPTVYGAVNASISLSKSVKDISGNDDKSSSGHHINDNTTKLGVKGSSKISDDLSGIYQAEIRVSTENDVHVRNTFVGLQGGFGTVTIGRMTPFANGAFMSSEVAAEGIVGNGAALFDGGKFAAAADVSGFGAPSQAAFKAHLADTYKNAISAAFDSRYHAVQYVSPNLNGVQVGLTLHPDEANAFENGANGTTAATPTESSITDNYELGVIYNSDFGVEVGLAVTKDGNNRYDSTFAGSATAAAQDTTLDKVADETAQSLSIAYGTEGMFKVGVTIANWKNGREGDVFKETSGSVNGLFADYYMGDIAFGLNYAKSTAKNDTVGFDDIKGTFLSFGTTYDLNNSIVFFANYADNKLDNDQFKAKETDFRVGLKSSF